MLELAACKTATQIYVVSEGKCPEEVEKKITTTKAPIEDSSNTPVAVCKRTEFTCSADNACISYIKRCNGRADCSDGQVSDICILYKLSHVVLFFNVQDEEACDGDCSMTQFRWAS